MLLTLPLSLKLTFVCQCEITNQKFNLFISKHEQNSHALMITTDNYVLFNHESKSFYNFLHIF